MSACSAEWVSLFLLNHLIHDIPATSGWRDSKSLNFKGQEESWQALEALISHCVQPSSNIHAVELPTVHTELTGCSHAKGNNALDGYNVHRSP